MVMLLLSSAAMINAERNMQPMKQTVQLQMMIPWTPPPTSVVLSPQAMAECLDVIADLAIQVADHIEDSNVRCHEEKEHESHDIHE
jgi:hypothetical protein